MMEKITIDGLPSTDRVFLLETGDYIRSRFGIKRPGNCCPSCGCKIIDGEDAVSIKVQVALCDESGNVLRDDAGNPVFKRKTGHTMQGAALSMGRSEAFSQTKQYLEDFVTAELAMWREFSGDDVGEL